MTKFYYKDPVKQVLIVKPDKDADDYNVWVLLPVCVGSVHRVGDKRFDVNGHHHMNVNSATRELLEAAGHPDLAEGVSPYMRTKNEVVQLTGADIMERDLAAWKKFCEARKLRVSDIKAQQKRYDLSQDEAKELGLVEAKQ